MITGKNYVGNKQSAKGDKTFKTFNPQTNSENQAVFTEATPEEIDEAVNLATNAFKTYRNISKDRKSKFLNTIADNIMALGDELIQTYCEESGLPEGRAKGERGRTVGQLRMFADLVKEGSWVEASIDTAIPDREPTPKPDLRKMSIPLGPVVVFGASNFPLAYSTAGGDTAAALAAGCPVLVKSHPMHAGTGEWVAKVVIEAAEETGMPNGVFSNLNSSGIAVGEQLVKHAGVKAVGFTGSIAGGRALYNLAAQRDEPIPVFAEMGSINPVVILPEALKSRNQSIAKTYANSITLGTGQFCTNPGLILGIKSKELSNFVQNLSDEIVKVEPTCMLHPNIIGAYESKKEKAIAQQNLSVVVNYEYDIKTNYARQTVTTVEGKTFLNNATLHQEVFGPYSMVVQCDDTDQLYQIISNLEGQLTGTIIAENDEATEYSDIVSALQNRVGRLIYNGVPTGVEVCPSMTHGGPYPASTDSRFTAVGIHSIKRWVRPFSYQDWPNDLLPKELKNENPLGILRLVNNTQTRDRITQ
ncbi:aldehyde dehydrogenase (NADP(+)) [Hanstruepera neustonica]|uniref:Aldehyde dehydrogenase (NADP(+)) n=1 Tax=Hanstruepera neustonica TaxID=1445657 RepID=A0A2K1E4H0_9FLAO|nr:aldehyde dehydrogenase (NADP(+)) [Hanstruepera neustonica]PNQ75131.1 aldehyde dehydrogenase (NADP(+)) [Hanstruepera neustonica]